MGIELIVLGRAAGDAGVVQTYSQKVAALLPLAHYIMGEASGTVAVDAINAFNGTYANVALAQPGIGDGNTSASYNGAGASGSSCALPAALMNAFNGEKCSVGGWFKVSAAGDWVDGIQRFLLRFQVDTSNFLNIAKDAANNSLTAVYKAGATTKTITHPMSPTAWTHVMMTCGDSANGDAFKFYVNGLQVGTTQTGNGAFSASALTIARLGYSFANGNVWKGLMGHWVPFNSVLSDAAILDLATV